VGPQGEVYAATGAPARVYRIVSGAQPAAIFQPQELQVQALVVDKDGVLATSLNAGANCNVPSLEIATPCEVPFTRSSYFDCSQVRVPSANMVSAVAKKRVMTVTSLSENIVS